MGSSSSLIQLTTFPASINLQMIFSANHLDNNMSENSEKCPLAPVQQKHVFSFSRNKTPKAAKLN